MGELDREARTIHGKVVYYGPQGSGKTANLECIDRKLKKEHRGDLKASEAHGEGGTYEFLPVELGKVRGYETSLRIYTVPGGESQGDLRQQILEDTDGVVFVADLRPDRHEATLASLEELTDHLGSYGRGLDDVVLVVQYNHSDAASETALDELHRRMGVSPAAHFEAVAKNGTGVLQTLTTLSKQVLSSIRRAHDEASGVQDATATVDTPVKAPLDDPLGTTLDAPLIDAEDDTTGGDFAFEAGEASCTPDGELSLPFTLVERSSERRIALRLRLRLDD